MFIKNRYSYFILFLSCFLIFTACKSKKRLAKASKNNIEKPSNSISSKYAELMNVSKRDIKNGKLYHFIDDWEGTKYRFGGLDKRGIDCSGLVYMVYQDVYNKKIPRNTAQQLAAIKRKYENQLEEGDLVFFDFDGKQYSHVGIYLQNGYFFHASTSKGVMVGKMKDGYNYKYFSRCGSLR